MKGEEGVKVRAEKGVKRDVGGFGKAIAEAGEGGPGREVVAGGRGDGSKEDDAAKGNMIGVGKIKQYSNLLDKPHQQGKQERDFLGLSSKKESVIVQEDVTNGSKNSGGFVELKPNTYSAIEVIEMILIFLLSASAVSKTSSRTSNSSAPSSLTIPSFSDRSNASTLPTPRTEEGGFGYVFKEWIDEHTMTAAKPGSGMVVTVKKLKPEGFQGHKEWLTEVNYLGQLHHPNLVKLIGYFVEGENQLLVYEFMPKGSLENHLFKILEFPNATFSILDALDLSSNVSHGPIPMSIFKLKILGIFSLSFNNFNGTIELGIIQGLSNRTSFDLSYNNLSVSSSSFGSNFTSLPLIHSIEVASCKLIAGKIPRLPPYASYIDLSNNNFTSSVPSDNGKNLSTDYTLDLNENLLTKRTPQSLASCRALEVFDVGNNDARYISIVFEKLLHLATSNNFSGEVPGQRLMKWDAMISSKAYDPSELNLLRFAFFQLDPFVYYQNAVIVTNKGHKMELVKILGVFTSINFSSNNFHGEILKKLGQLKCLPGNQIQTFLASSFEGNDGLCGPPLPPHCMDDGARMLLETPKASHSKPGIRVEWDLIAAEIGFIVWNCCWTAHVFQKMEKTLF
ncbi:hypothetical protein FNV43_RR08820 [Rhamnella rubrinervis]|uniref:Protein kinase domain-containing protein n=1 Tax=Rhamnella rubrinervis TaxID=2594499 RepID=A0A8K0HA01_9ROSA|nr:hypothetical protein FNV43_RR08820 [Rhamnella rubrinervis]